MDAGTGAGGADGVERGGGLHGRAASAAGGAAAAEARPAGFAEVGCIPCFANMLFFYL